jgi:sugar O-acyltransferase (sialic acid O-acetyltransferase NeuD family)
MRVAIVGAGGHGKVAYDILRLVHGDEPAVVFFDDAPEKRKFLSRPVGGQITALLGEQDIKHVFVAIGDNHSRAKIVSQLIQAGKIFLSLVHPWTSISPHAQIGTDSIAVAGTVVNADARVGDHVILNTHCSVGHDCRVEDFAQIAPGINLGGSAVIGEGAFLGIGVKVARNVRVGSWSIVGAGSVVLHDIPPNTFAYGTPARVVRELEGTS